MSRRFLSNIDFAAFIEDKVRLFFLMTTVMICLLWSHAMIKSSARYLMLAPLPAKLKTYL